MISSNFINDIFRRLNLSDIAEFGHIYVSPKVTINRFLHDPDALSKSLKLYLIGYAFFWTFISSSFVSLGNQVPDTVLVALSDVLFLLCISIAFYVSTKAAGVCPGFRASLILIALFRAATSMLGALLVAIVTASIVNESKEIFLMSIMLAVGVMWEFIFVVSYGLVVGARKIRIVGYAVIFETTYYFIYKVFAHISHFTNSV